MKFLHISDLHLGKQLAEYSLLDDQRYILRQILDIAAAIRISIVIVAGDLYDKPVPPAEAVTVLDWFITSLTEMQIPLLMIGGNHDSPERLDFGSGLFEEKGVYLVGQFNGAPKKVTLGKPGDQADFYLLPFIRPGNVRPFFPDEEIKSYDDAMRCIMENLTLSKDVPSVLVAHQFVTAGGVSPERSESEIISLGGTDNVDVSNFIAFQYVALGHIHRPQRLTRDSVRYAGSPLKYSFSEAEYDKSVVQVTLNGMEEPTIELIPLEPVRDLRRIRGPLEKLLSDEVVSASNREDYLHVTLTDTEPVADPLYRLRQVYPNIMRLAFASSMEEEQVTVSASEEVERRTPPQLFAEFYSQMQGEPLSEEDGKLVLRLMEKIWGNISDRSETTEEQTGGEGGSKDETD